MAIDRELTAKVIQTAMSPKTGLKGMVTSYFQKGMEQKMIDQIIGWLERYDRTKENIRLIGAPFLLYRIMERVAKGRKKL